MRQVIVELDYKEMAQLEAVARARNIDPADVLKVEALRVFASDAAIAHLAPATSTDDKAAEQRRQARLAILMRSNGIFSGESNKPKDGLVYQQELRAEWQ
jgi:hypothetical protein